MFSHIFFTGKQLMRLGIETLQKGSNLKGKEKKYLPFLSELNLIKEDRKKENRVASTESVHIHIK